ncbi:MAG: hypothetical protein L0226_13065 [Acidobacteria bacterium]|nr:hypothetical protein [Acidobacteriota bacterium]
MRKISLLVSLCSVLLLGLFVFAAAQSKASYAGTWALDKAKSEGLSQRLQGADSVSWVVTQDDKQLTREQKVEGGQGGQGGGRGAGMGAGQLTVKLDGSETSTDRPQISGKSTTKATWQDGGKILEVSTVTTGNIQGNDFKATTTEHWELAEGGKVLKVHQKAESPRGTTESKMVFTKK